TIDAAVSSQLDSIPKIMGFLFIKIVFNNSTIFIQIGNKLNEKKNNYWF
mgnify:CR=1